MFVPTMRSTAVQLILKKNTTLAFALLVATFMIAAASIFPAYAIAAQQTRELAHQKMTAIDAGNTHVLAIRADGTLWAWGDNTHGQLGLSENPGGATRAHSIPQNVRVGDASSVVLAAAGAAHSLAIDDEGRLWAWGRGAKGRLGLGDTEDRTAPVQVNTAAQHSWQAISAGGGHSLALASDGTLWAWGENGFGQLGVGNRDNQNLPQQVSFAGGPSVWKAIAAGSDFSLALSDTGRLYAWGNGAHGRLGLGAISSHTRPQLVGDAGMQWDSVSAGWNHVLALRSDGSLWAWGSSEAGQLGTGARGLRTTPARVTEASNWISISAGFDHSSALDSAGNLWTWGSGGQGQLGLGNADDLLAPAQVEHDTGAAQWTLHAAGKGFTQAYDSAGSPYNWGWNVFGQSGSGVFCENLLASAIGISRDHLFRMAAAPIQVSRHDWTPSERATTPIHGTEDLPIATDSITLYFDRPMIPGFGAISIDNQAVVDIEAGQWSESAQGPNTVFTVPLTLQNFGVVHTVTTSDFVDAQFGQDDSNEAYPFNFSFMTEERAITPTGLSVGTSNFPAVLIVTGLLGLCVFVRARRRAIESFAAQYFAQGIANGQSPSPNNKKGMWL